MLPINVHFRSLRGAGSLLLLGLLLATAALRAQSGAASLQGTVTDPSGAVLPGSKVVLTSASTGVALEGSTDSTGNYSFPTVTPGVYNLEFTKEGFAPYRVSGLNVVVGQRVAQNAGVEPVLERLGGSNRGRARQSAGH